MNAHYLTLIQLGWFLLAGLCLFGVAAWFIWSIIKDNIYFGDTFDLPPYQGWKDQPRTWREPYRSPRIFAEEPIERFETIAGYLVDPNSKVPCIFVSPQAIIENRICGGLGYVEQSNKSNAVRLVKSGSGFRVYEHPTIIQGTWLPCR